MYKTNINSASDFTCNMLFHFMGICPKPSLVSIIEVPEVPIVNTVFECCLVLECRTTTYTSFSPRKQWSIPVLEESLVVIFVDKLCVSTLSFMSYLKNCQEYFCLHTIFYLTHWSWEPGILGWGCTLVVECSPRMHEALGLIPSTL